MRWNQYISSAITGAQTDKLSRFIKALYDNDIDFDSAFEFELLDVCQFEAQLHNSETNFINQYNTDSAGNIDLNLGWNTQPGTYVQEDTNLFISGVSDGRSIHSYSLDELLNIIDLATFENELASSFRTNYKKGPVSLLGNKFDVSKDSIQMFIRHVYASTYQELRRDYLKEALRPYLAHGYDAQSIAPFFGLKPSRASATLNRWSQEAYGTTFKDAKRALVKQKIRLLLVQGYGLVEISNQLNGLEKRGVQSIILEEWNGIYNARRILAEPILEHLCRIDATHAQVQEVLGISNVNAYTQKLWGMSFSEAKDFFRDLYLGSHSTDFDLPPF